MKSLDQYWYSKNPVAILLWPVSLLFYLLVFLRQLFYRFRLFESITVSKPVIVVGNISVGGTGKTPLIIELGRLLTSWGYKVGIISRGYGGQGPWPYQLDDNSTAEVSGDEPLQIFQRTGLPVVVGPDRIADAQMLIDNNEVDLLLADDGMQHYRLNRNLELIVIDAQRQFGNQFMLPAGPLREPVSRLKKSGWPVFNGGNINGGKNDGDQGYAFKIEPSIIKNLVSCEEESISTFQEKSVHAVAGIGNPQRFFQMLRDNGFSVIEHAFPDHYVFNEDDLDFGDSLPVLMTEKDSVKCKKFSNKKLWFVAIDIQLSEPFVSDFKRTVNELVNG